MVDVRAKALALDAVELHSRKVNSLHCRQAPGATEMASSSTDASVCIWDLRKLGEPLATCMHDKSAHGAYFAPDGSRRVMSTSYDNSVRVWGEAAAEWSIEASIAHNNQTGRWISPFRAVWSPDAAGGFIGDMKRAVDAFQLSHARSFRKLESELMTAIPSRVACHPALPVVAAGTSSGRVHLWAAAV